ncbi:MAG: FAD-binding oxidoreductase, partial [Clostridiales bacterium]|nr:FAD-binding oxidoreductase [Clostridiales bacterium]
MDGSSIFEKKNVSLWLKDGITSKLPTLEQDIDCDVCIVGAGITGITTAYSLHEAGFKVVLIDKQEPLHLATGNTSAKFTYQHDLIYSELIKHHDLDKARLYYEAQVEGLAYVRALIDKHSIRCDFKETSAIVYAETEEQFNELLEEKAAYEKLDIPHELIYEIPLNIVGTGGLKVPFQFELNPVKYLDALLSYLLEQGVPIFKNTEAKTVVSEGEGIKVVTSDQKTISSKHLVIATAYPFFGGDGFYFTRLAASRFYMTAYPITDHHDDDVMIISNADSPHSFRFSDTDGVKYILVGGEGHRVGTVDSQVNSYDLLAGFAKTYFNVGEPAFKWSAQDYKTV